jgi:hypothetical protein
MAPPVEGKRRSVWKPGREKGYGSIGLMRAMKRIFDKKIRHSGAVSDRGEPLRRGLG